MGSGANPPEKLQNINKNIIVLTFCAYSVADGAGAYLRPENNLTNNTQS